MKNKKEKIKIITPEIVLTNFRRAFIIYKLKRAPLWLLGTLFGIFLGICFLFLFYQIAFASKVYLGVKLGPYNLSGKNFSQIDDFLKEGIKKFDSKIILLLGEEKREIEFSEIDLKFDIKKTKEEIEKIGRENGFLKNLINSIKVAFFSYQVKASFDIDKEKLENQIKLLAKEFLSPPVDARLEIKDSKVILIPSIEGRGFDLIELREKILENLSNLDNSAIKVQINRIEPKIKIKDLSELKRNLEKILSRPLLLKNPFGKDFKIAPQEIASWIEIGSKDFKLKEDLLLQKLEQISLVINRPPIDAKIIIENNSPHLIARPQSGRALNLKAMKNRIKEALKNGENEIELAVELIEPTIKTEKDLEKAGIIELIGRGISDFKGSPPNRVHNIKIGAQVFNGVLIKPDEIFSFNKILGEVSARTGYLPELVIKEDRTIPEYGGGLCQVSTTLFRAALNAGLEIIERTPHAYRVSYYEPAGLDATIYFPSPDLKFKNNTGAYILVQSKIEGTKLIFDLYGTKKYKVEIEGPYIYNIKSPGEPIYIETDELNPGEEKIIERAHKGADTKVIRRIYDLEGNLIKEEQILSHYQAWRAKILKGKEKEEAKEEHPL